jgi:phytoene desaturase
MDKKKLVIVGAGPGGLSAGMMLSSAGYQVDIYEIKDKVGGRNAAIKIDGYTFDTGPTFLMLPRLLEEMFEATGRDIKNYLDLKEIDPLYRLKFTNKNIDFYPTRDRQQMLKNIKECFPGDEKNYEKFLFNESKKFNRLFKCLQIPYHSLFHFLRIRFIKAIPDFEIGKSLHQILAKYFKNEDMQIAMAFQAKYLGMSPWECPGAFTILSFIEHSEGIYHPIGGLNKISEAMAKVIKENGGNINFKSEVKEILVEDKKAIGIKLTNGKEIKGDHVIINADFAHAMTNIVSKENRKKYTDENLKNRDYSCSTFMLYLGLSKKYDIPHHNIIFADDYHENVKEIYNSKELSKDPSFYIQNPSIIDPTLAPKGKSALYVLVPVANTTSKIDWGKEKAAFRNLIIKKIKEKTELKDIEKYIEVEKIITPMEWKNDYNIYNGATFNLSHKLTQMLYFRPHNKFEEFENCYLVGGGTHPGSGLPTIYESGRIAANLISKNKTASNGVKDNSSKKVKNKNKIKVR